MPVTLLFKHVDVERGGARVRDANVDKADVGGVAVHRLVGLRDLDAGALVGAARCEVAEHHAVHVLVGLALPRARALGADDDHATVAAALGVAVLHLSRPAANRFTDPTGCTMRVSVCKVSRGDQGQHGTIDERQTEVLNSNVWVSAFQLTSTLRVSSPYCAGSTGKASSPLCTNRPPR